MSVKSLSMPERLRGYARIQVDREELNPKLQLVQRNLVAWCLNQGRFLIGQPEIDFVVIAEMAYQIHQRTGNRAAILTDTIETAVSVVAAADELDISISNSLDMRCLKQTGIKVVESAQAHHLWDLIQDGYFDGVLQVGIRAMAVPPDVHAAIMEHCPFVGLVGALRSPQYSLFDLHGARVGVLVPVSVAEQWIH